MNICVKGMAECEPDFSILGIFAEFISPFAQLHGILKIKTSNIIRLPRSLSEEEFARVKMYPQYGGEIVDGLAGLEMVCDIIMEHHEKSDGSGYPAGKKKGEDFLAG